MALDTNSLFYQMLYMKRLSIGAANRKKSANASLPTWLYPHSIERSYGTDLIAIMQQFKNLANSIFDNDTLDNWVNEFKQDKADSWQEAIDNFKNDSAEETELQKKMKVYKECFDSEEWTETELKLDGFLIDFAAAISTLKSKSVNIFQKNPEPARRLISSAGINTSLFNLKQWTKITKRILGVDFIPTEAWEMDVVNAWGQDNFNLISNLADEYIKKINNVVSEGVQFGKSSGVIREQIAGLNKKLLEDRSRLIARDQIGKLNGQFTKRRQQDVGIDMYTWLTAGDERVRSTHKQMNDKICRWDNANVYSLDGITWASRPSLQGLIPGQDIQCRCTAIPYMELIYRQIDEAIMKAA